MSNSKIGIIGSGPSGLATAQIIAELYPNSRITLFDIGKNISNEINSKVSGYALKTYKGSAFSYNQSQNNLIHLDKRPVVWPSKGWGGYSRVWGASIGEIENGYNPFNDFYTEFNSEDLSSYKTKSAKVIQQKINIHIKDLNSVGWQQTCHSVAVRSKSCTSCGSCLTGCPTDSIWYAGDHWQYLKNLEIKLNSEIVRISEAPREALIFDSSGNQRAMDKIYICAGPISTAKILMESGYLPNKVTISDSQTIFIPYLKWPNLDSKERFALSQLSLKRESPEGTSHQLQIYPDVRSLYSRIGIKNPLLQRVLERIWIVASMFSGAAIGYLDSRNSDSFEIIKSPVGYEFSEKISISRDERTEHIRRFRAALSAIGLLPIRMLIRFAKPGEGYHFGSINELVVDPTTKLLGKTKRIYVMDASSSSRISAGPVTYPVMADIRRSLQKQQKMDEL